MQNMVVIYVLVLIFFAVITYIDWKNPDKKARATGPSAIASANANNKRKEQQILDLQDRVDFLNAKYNDRTFYREGAYIKDRSGGKVPSTKGFNNNTGDQHLARHEFPHLLAPLLSGFDNHEISWSSDEQQIILKLGKVYTKYGDCAEYTRRRLIDIHFSEDKYRVKDLVRWAEQLTFIQIENDKETLRPQVAIKPSDLLLQDEDYLRMEVENHGRVFLRNLSNSYRNLLGWPNETENLIKKGASAWDIQLSRFHSRPKFISFSEMFCTAKMSRKQIVDNLESRLWKRKKVDLYREFGDIVQIRVI